MPLVSFPLVPKKTSTVSAIRNGVMESEMMGRSFFIGTIQTVLNELSMPYHYLREN